MRAMPVVTVVCLVLVTLLTAVQVAHFHLYDNDADRCPLCIAMHSAAPVAVMTAVVSPVRIEASTPVPEARAIVRHWHPKLFTRPPPADC
jgi:hypothetical protein